MLSFLKGRPDKLSACHPDKEGGMLAVWGSPGCGKTTVAVKLAKHLADKKKNVMLILCDMVAPMLPCICPSNRLDSEQSLSKVLVAEHVTESLVRSHCMTHKTMPHLAIMGLLKGENEYSCRAYTAQQATELLAVAREIAPYVIVDCSSYLTSDILSTKALMDADDVLRMVNANIKSVSYLSSQLPVLLDERWDVDKQYKTLCNVKSYEADSQAGAALGNMAFTVPHSDEVEAQYLAGNLLDDLCLKDSRPFRKELSKMAREVFGV